MIHDLDDEVFVNVEAKPAMLKTILTLFLAKINPDPFFFLLKGELATDLSLLSIKSKSSVFAFTFTKNSLSRVCAILGLERIK